MALQIWLPLTGSFENQGLYNLGSPSRNTFNSTVKLDGKIGACQGQGNLQFHSTEDDLLLDNKWTAAAWILYSGSATATGIQYIITKNAAGGFADMQMSLHLSSSQRICSCIDGTEYKSPALTQSFVENTWYHVATTYDGSTYKFYLNGNCVGSGSVTKTRLAGKTNINIGTRSSNAAGTGGSGGILSGSRWYNDVRLYDEALSAREIKEISKGLVAHWTMNDPTPAVGYKLRDSSGYGRHASFTSAGQPIVSGSVNSLSSPHYTNYVHFNTNAKFASASLPIEAIDRQYTFAWWGMLTSTTTGCMYWAFTGSSTRTNMYMANTGTSWNTGDGNDGDPFRKAGTTTALGKLARGAWHHYAITGDGEKTLLYVDGTLTAEATFYKNLTYALGTASVTPADRVFHINGWGQGTSYRNARTHMSDLRVYSTALSAEDVRELAKNPISVCKGGTLMCQEVVE